jgi:nucleoside-diphosphate-sugar epimerase
LTRILVTGAAGFIGSHATERLLELGYEVIGVDSFTGYYARERKLRNLARAAEERAFRLVEGDLLELNLEELLQGVSSVVHLAAEPGVRASWGGNFSRYLERNVEATQRLLEALPERGLERFVFASSSSVYGSVEEGPVKEDSRRRPASPYGLSKLAAEELVGIYGRERGVPATVLRYFTVYGPRQRPEMALSRFISFAVRGEALQVFGDGNQVREMTYVSDVVEATVAALEAPLGGTYNVGGGARATVNELIELVQRTLGDRVEVTYGPAAEGDVRSTWADLTRVGRELGYRPRVGLEEGTKAQVEWALREELSSSRG